MRDKNSLPLDRYHTAETLLSHHPERYRGNPGQIRLAEDAGISHLSLLYKAIKSRSDLGWSYIGLPLRKYRHALRLLEAEPERYKGNRGQVRLAREVGVTGLKFLYAAFKQRDLGWSNIGLTLEQYDRARNLLDRDVETYRGEEGQVRLAREAGIYSLSHLYTCFGRERKLGWRYINLPLERYSRMSRLLERDPERYKGTRGQLLLAEEGGATSTYGLHTAFGHLGLGWKLVRITLKKYRAMEKLLSESRERYKGNDGQVRLAQEVGVCHLSSLYEALDAPLTMGWSKMTLPLRQYLKARERLASDPNRYKGMAGMIELSRECGITRLADLYTGFGKRKELKWKKVNLSLKEYDLALELIRRYPQRYRTQKGQIELARDSGITHLNHLYSGFGYLDELDWKVVNIPLKKYDSATSVLESNPARYSGMEGQLRLARDTGILHLGSLYTGFGRREELRWKKVDLHADKYLRAEELLRGGKARYSSEQGLVRLAKDAGIDHMGKLYTAFGHLEELGWTYAELSHDGYLRARELLESHFEAYTGSEGLLKLSRDAGGISAVGLYQAFHHLPDMGWHRWSAVHEQLNVARKLLEDDFTEYRTVEGQVLLAQRAEIAKPSLLFSAFKQVIGLRWRYVGLSTHKYALASTLLESEEERYRSIEGMVKLAEDAGIAHLPLLYSAFGRRRGLNWKLMTLSVRKYRRAEELLGDHPCKYATHQGQIELARDSGISSLSALYSAFGHRRNLKWKRVNLHLRDIQ